MKLPLFNGETVWPIFKRQFEVACDTNRWGQNEKVTALMLALREPVADLIQTLPNDKQITYEELTHFIEHRF